MTICGVIAEYNPFHNGHAYQLAEARKRSSCDAVVVCMDGGFTQRGDAALVDKWTRAQAALENGADLVVELPALFAVRSADRFARGGVETLAALGVNALSFGCETDDLSLLMRLRDAFHHETGELSAAIQRNLASGLPYVRARGEAVAEILSLPPELLSSPNLTLALEYIHAAENLPSPISFFPIVRTSGYHDASLGHFASASAIRAAIFEKDDSWQAALPEGSKDLLTDCLQSGHYALPEGLDSVLLYRLRTSSSESLAALCDVSEGLERLFFKEAASAVSRRDLLERVKNKRYTHARLNRFCAHVLLSMTRADAAVHPHPEYIRVLGFRKDAQPLLRQIKKTAALPFVTDPTLLKNNSLFRFDCAASDLQALSMADPKYRTACSDFKHRVVIV